jgi:protein O-GlcNAc transferase
MTTSDKEILIKKALLFFRHGDYKKSHSFVNKLKKDLPDDPVINSIFLMNKSCGIKNLDKKLSYFIDKFNNDEINTCLNLSNFLKYKFIKNTLFLNIMGIIHIKINEFDTSEFYFHKALEINPIDLSSLRNLGNLYLDRENFIKAYETLIKVTEIDEANCGVFYNLGTTCLVLKKNECAFNFFEKCIAEERDDAAAYLNYAISAYRIKKLDLSLKLFDIALSKDPSDINILNGMLMCSERIGNITKSIELTEKLLSEGFDNPVILTDLAFNYLLSCNYVKFREVKRTLENFKTEDFIEVQPWKLLPVFHDPLMSLRLSEAYSTSFNDMAEPIRFPTKATDKLSGRTRVGYFSSKTALHAVTVLIFEILELHNRKEFEIYFYATEEYQDDEVSARIKKYVDVFDDLSEVDPKSAVKLVRQDNLDIAVDLTGYTESADPTIFATRIAPIQVSYLGYPGTMGANFYDYIIADKVLIPNDQKKYYREKVVQLPYCYQPQPTKMGTISPQPKSVLRIPEEKFVFCAIHNPYKIDENLLTIWMNLLASNKNSVLWLLSKTELAEENLITFANKHNIESNQLVFYRGSNYTQYLSDLQQADVFLDAFAYNAGSTASDVLRMGVPIITKLGKRYCERMSASLLSALGMEELIVQTEAQYTDLCNRLCKEKDYLNDVKNRLKIAKSNSPLYNNRETVGYIEAAFHTMLAKYNMDINPESFAVPVKTFKENTL